MKALLPKKYKGVSVKIYDPIDGVLPPFVIHPPTSELAERLLIDPQALSNENYSGIYDESGDYVPQYCDDPEKIPQGKIVANSESPSTDAPLAASVGADVTPSLSSSDTDDSGE